MFKRNLAKVNPPKKFQAYSNQRMQLPTNGLTLQFRKPVLSYNALLPKPTSLYNINNTTFQKKFVFNKGKVSYDPQKQMIGSKLGKGVQDPTKGINVSLNFLRDNPGSKKPSRPVGRGIGNGRGKTSTRGHKGHKARSGGRGGSTFKNESINLYKKVKKFGKKNPFKLNWSYVNLDQLSQFIQHGRIDTSSLITAQTLKDAGIIKNPRDGVKLLADGYSTWNHKIDIQVAQTSQKAKIAVELAGGRVTKQWYNMVALNHLLHPHKYNFETKIGLPKLSREWRFENKTLKETIEEFEEN